MSVLREIAAKLGFEVDDRPLKQAGKSVDDLVRKIESFASMAVAYKIVGNSLAFINEQIEAGSKISLWADRLGVTKQEFQQLDFAAQQAGVSTDQFTLAMKLFEKHVGDAEEGTKTATKLFSGLGMEVLDATGKAKPMPELLGELADHFQKNDSYARRSADALHLMGKGGAYMIPFLRQGRAAVEEMMGGLVKFGGGIRDEVIDGSRKAAGEIKKLEYGMKVLKSELAFGATSAFMKVAGALEDTVVWLIDMGRHTTVGETMWYALGAAAVAAAVAALVAWAPVLVPILLIAGAALLAYLAFDDFYALMNGNKSLIGTWLAETYGMEGAKQRVQALRDAWKEFTTFVSDVALPVLKSIGGILVEGAIAHMKAFGYIINWILPKLRMLIAMFQALRDADVEYNQKRAEGKGVVSSLFGEGGYVSSLFGGRAGQNFMDKMRHNFGTTSPGGEGESNDVMITPNNVMAPPAPNNGPGIGTQVNNTKIQIDGAKDPKQVAEQISKDMPWISSDPVDDASFQAWGQ